VTPTDKAQSFAVATPQETDNDVKNSPQVQNTKEISKDQNDRKKFEEIASILNEHMDDLQTNLGFSIRDDLNHLVIVEIKNRKTDELVKQIPAEELLMIKEKMEELTGLIFDQKA